MLRRASFVLALSMSAAALATPFKLEYSINPVGDGTFRYNFTLTLDNNDGTWFPGQRINWIIWGDAIYPGPSLFSDFIPDLPAPGPFADEGFSNSGGGHNGPTLLDFGTNTDFRGWVPDAIGDNLVWSGTSAYEFPVGQLKWSNLIGSGVFADFETAILVGDDYCPADYDGSGGVDGADVEAFYRDWEDGENAADVNRDGSVDGSDVETFYLAWEAGGC